MTPTNEDLMWCYKSILGREPESMDAAQKQLNGVGDFRELVLRFIQSDEFKEKTNFSANYPQNMKAIMASIPEVHKADLFNVNRKWFDYKRISLDKVLADILISGDWAEFGVYKGDCAKLMLKELPTRSALHLFDSFEGLPEDWVGNWKKGSFAMPAESIPVFTDTRVKVVRGFFKDSLPGYFSSSAAPLAFIHMDADLYSSTWDVLRNCNHVIVPGTVILFDEYVMFGKDDEHRAFVEWTREFGREFKYLWRTRWVQVAVRIEK
jgi:macrocin-O-methyltransferase TylF-like protien